MQRMVPQTLAARFALIERHGLQGPWILDEAYSVANGHRFTIAGWLEADGVDITQCPRVQAHFQAAARLAQSAARSRSSW